MSTNIPAVQDTGIQHCLLVDLEVSDTETYYLSNAYTPLTYNSNEYTQMGYLMNMTELQGDIRPTNNQITISLSGIPSDLVDDPGFLNMALNTNLKGSKIRIYRAFLKNGQLDSVYQRFSGYVSNFSLNETWDDRTRVTTQSVNLSCSSVHAIIEKQYNGRRTNEKDFGTDTCMYRVKAISDSQFDFGKKAS